MAGKHVRYFTVESPKGVAYHKLESDLCFSVKEGRDLIKENNPDATKITHLNKEKAEGFLGLMNLKP